MQAQELVLRDVHVPAAPSLWPPAPGWWLVAAAVLAVIAIIWLLNWRRQRTLKARQRLFDDACSNLPAAAQIAAMSELLRRAARQLDKQADRLQGDAWLRWSIKRVGGSGINASSKAVRWRRAGIQLRCGALCWTRSRKGREGSRLVLSHSTAMSVTMSVQ